jgi:bla regulator protein blaR1
MMLATLLGASLNGAILVAIVWAVNRCLPRLSAATRSMLWWCAAAKFLLALVWTAPVLVPILPKADGLIPNAGTTVEQVDAGFDARTIPSAAGAPDHGGWIRTISPAWSVVLYAAWSSGFLLSAGLGLRRWRQTVAMVKRSSAASPAIEAMTADLVSRLRLPRVPQVRLSDEVDTPLVAGPLQPVVLLPADRFAQLSDRQQRMALCHELAHVKRADLWLGCLPALAERVFFFHPLVHLAAREYALWREAACDAHVLDALDAAPQEYGRLLLELGVSRPRTGLAAAGAPWSFSNLKRRIVMLRHPSSRSMGSRLVGAAAVAIAAAAMVPMQLVARTTSRAVVADELPQAPSAHLAASAVDPKSSRDPDSSLADPSTRSLLAPREEAAQRKDRDLSYVMFLDEDRTTMSGSSSDIERARRFKRPGEQLLWFRQAGREYVVRDPAILRQVEALWKPVHVIGEQQGKLGAEQGELGSKQGEIGARQGVIGAEQGTLGARQGELGARQGALAAREAGRELSAAEKGAIETERREIELQMRDLSRQMAQLGEKMREFEKPMRELGDQMEVLGKEMGVLGRKMEEEVRKAEAEMRALVARAIASGDAQEVK